MNKHHLVKPTCTVAAVISAFSCAVSAQSQKLALEEVIVVAQKREQSLQDVPISVSVIDEEMLLTRQIYNLTDIGANVPNLFVNPVVSTPTSVRMFIRGIGQNDVQVTQDPSVALYLDGVYIGTSIGAGFDGVDVERLEVLRGPQGTLYGRNATGGAVNIITRRASTEAPEFKLDLTAGNLDTYKANVIANLPVGNRAAVKINYLHNEREEITSNRGPGEEFGMRDTDSLVLDLRVEASDTVTLDYRYEAARGENSQRYDQTTEASFTALLDPAYIDSDRLDTVTSVREIRDSELDIDAHSLFLSWDINDSMTLKSISSWRDLENLITADAIPTASIPFSILQSDFEFEQFSQELQLIGSTGSLEYVVGLYYYDDESEMDGAGTVRAGAISPPDFTSAENESRAIFGQFTWIPVWMDQRWQLTLGARYSDDKREAFRINDLVGFTGNYDNDFTNFTPSITVGFDINESMNVYGKVVSGFRSGGTSQRSASAILFAEGFDEEDIISYELGFKGDVWDRRARLNLALFYMELDGMQTSVQTGSSPGDRDFLPVDGNTIWGGEFDLTLLLSDSLRLRLDYGYLDTEVGEDVVYSGDPTLGDNGFYALTDEMTLAPNNSATVSVDYSRSLGNMMLDLNVNYVYQDESLTSLNADDVTVLDDYGLWGAAVTLSDIDLGKVPGDVRVVLWGKNLTDEEYGLISTAAWSAVGATEQTTFGDPRTYGLTLSYVY